MLLGERYILRDTLMNTYNYENVECISRSTNQCRQIILLGETLLETHIQGKKYNNNNDNTNNK